MSEFEVHRKFVPLLKIAERAKGYEHIDTVIISGGRNSFKSYTVSGLLAVFMIKYNWKTLFTRYTMESAEDSVIAEVNEKIQLFGFSKLCKTIKRRIVKLTGETITENEEEEENKPTPQIVFKGVKTSSGDQTGKLKSLKGFNCYVLDEADEHPSYKDFRTIQRSIRRKDLPNVSILIFNPPTKAHWIYKEFFESKGLSGGENVIIDNVCYIHMTYLDMKRFVADNILADYERAKLNDYEDYKNNILGAFREKAEGTIFKRWKYGEFDNTLPFSYGSDYGFKPDPDVLVKVAIDNKRKKLYVKEEFCSTELTATELVDKIKAIVGRNILHAESQEQRINEMLKREQVKVYPTQKYPNSVEDGIKMMLDFEIIVDPESINIGTELNNYVEKNGKPLSNGYDHRLDAIRYNVMGTLTVKVRIPTRLT